VSILYLAHNSKIPVMASPEYDNYESWRQMTTSLTRSWPELRLTEEKLLGIKLETPEHDTIK